MGALTPEEVHGAALLGERYEAHLALLSSDPTRGRDAELARSRQELFAAGRECLYLGLPTVGSDTAAVLRQAARQGFLGDPLLVIGPEALIAYGLAAGSRIGQAFPAGAPLELLDGPEDADTAAFDVLMTVCGGPYRASRGRAGPVRNPAGHEVRLHRPDPGTEPEGAKWLLGGRTVARDAVSVEGIPAPIVAPDPRTFALRKLWLARRTGRDPADRERDAGDGAALLEALAAGMPGFPLHEGFAGTLPGPLREVFDRWQARRQHPAPSSAQDLDVQSSFVAAPRT